MHRKQMKRYEDGRVRFITFSTYQRLPLFQNDAIKDAFVPALSRARDRAGALLFAWVVMPEHVHLLLMPRSDSVADMMASLKASFARAVIRR